MIKFPASNPSGANQKLCLASCFLPLNADNCRWWLRIQDELLAQGVELVLVSSAPAVDARLRTIVVPLWLDGYQQAYAPESAPLTLEEPLALALAKRDRLWTRQADRNLSGFTAGLAVCQQVWRTLLNELAPSVVLVWGSSLPQSVVLQQLALQQGRPCWVLERGLLPGTLMLELFGHGGCSELNWSFTIQQTLQKSKETNLFAAAQSAYKKNRASKYSQAGVADPAVLRQRFNPDGRKIVSLLLQHDGATAMAPDDYLGARVHAPEIPSSTDAIRALSEVLSQNPACRLIVKPHPMDQDDYSHLENAQVTVSREVNLHALIEASDVVACQSSSTQFEALLYEKPILLLAHSPLAGKGVAYEPRRKIGLADALHAALERQDFDQRMTLGRRFIHFLLSNFSIALTDTSHAVPGLGELAAFIAGNSISTDSTLSVNQRLSKVGEWFNLWESTAKERKASTLDLLPELPATNEAGADNPAAVEKPIERTLPGTAADAPPLWQRDESLKEVGAQLSRQPSSIRVVSFDFFDTLVGRLCAAPADLFIEVGRQLAARGWFSRPCTPMEFHSARVAADARARKNAANRGRLPEIKLADIYAELKNIVRDVTAACQLEFDIERQYIFLNPATVSLARHAKALGYRVAVISDTYFTAAQLQQLLSENGCPAGLFDLVLASCEHGKAKWNGQLYQELFKHFDIHPAELLHLGDDKNADIHSARQYGVNTVEYYKRNPQLDRLLFTERKLRGTDQHPAAALDCLRILTARRADSEQDAFRDGAFIFGPVLARYADWCVDQFKAAKVHTVLALMREGELLGELVRRAAAAAGVELKIVTCFTSRRATARASLTEPTPAAVMELLEGSATVTFQSILDVLGLGEEIARQCDPNILKATLAVDHRLTEILKLLFQNPRVQQLLEANCAASHALAFDYLTSLTGSATRVGILDIGWGGSIQRNIARILRRHGREVSTFGCYLARTRKTGRLALDGDEVHAFMEQDWNQCTILPELAISSTVGSTNDYQRDPAGAVQPVLGKCELTPAEREIRRRIRDGILEFQSFWLNLRSQKRYSPATLADLDQQTASIFYRLLEYPSKAEADRLGTLTHDENYFGAHLTSQLCDETTASLLRRDGMHTLIQTTRCHWPQGVLARENPRLVNALGMGWSDPPLLGRLGARHGSSIGEQGLTDEEVSALGLLVSGLGLRQIILVGPLVPAMIEVFQLLWQQEKEDPLKNQPRLIIAGSAGGSTASPEFLSRCTFVNGDTDDPRTIHALRAALVPGVNAALVVPGELPETTLLGLLHGLAPFLGRDGALFIACGRYDRNAILETLPAARTVNAWRQKNAAELGFGLWTGPAALAAQLGNWLVFRRALTQMVWNNQWTFTAADLAVAEPAEDLLVKP